jgi:predicted nuclease of predicted toxin-antitoxin system
MKILLDECLPRKMKYLLKGEFEVFTVKEKAWDGLENGDLMKAAVKEYFDVFVTADKNLRYQQNIADYEIAIVLMNPFFDTLENIKPLIPKLLKLLPQLEKRKFYLVE